MVSVKMSEYSKVRITNGPQETAENHLHQTKFIQ